jgi:hypothetical protein
VRQLIIWAVAGLLALLAACGGGEDRSKAQLRLVNASGGYAGLDLVVDDRRLQTGVAYGATDRYVEVDPAETATQVTRPGSSTPLVSTTPALRKGERYTLVAYGAEGALRAALLDDNTTEPASGKARVRVLNAAPDAGSVDVYLTTAEADLADAEALQAGAVAGAVGAFSNVDAATWRLRVTAAGDRNDLRLDLTGLVLTNRQIVTVVVTPGAGGVLVNALVITQRGAIAALDGARARVRAVAAVTDSGAVAATVGGVNLMNGIGAPAAGAYRLVPAGTPAAAVTVNGAPVAVPASSLASGTDHTLLVWGPAGAAAAAWLADDNRPPTVTNRAKLRLVHGLAGLDVPIALTVDFSPVADGVGPGTASAPAQLDASTTATLSVTAPGRASPVWSAVEQTLVAGNVYTLFVVGHPDAPTGILRKDR